MVNQKGVFIKFKLGNAKQISGFIPKRHLFESDAAANENDDDEEEENVNGEKLKKLVYFIYYSSILENSSWKV